MNEPSDMRRAGSPVPAPADRPEATGRVIPSADLFGTAREILIEHQGSYYRLRLTRSGKLILHK